MSSRLDAPFLQIYIYIYIDPERWFVPLHNRGFNISTSLNWSKVERWRALPKVETPLRSCQYFLTWHRCVPTISLSSSVFVYMPAAPSQTEWLEHLDKVTLECAEKVKMEPAPEPRAAIPWTGRPWESGRLGVGCRRWEAMSGQRQRKWDENYELGSRGWARAKENGSCNMLWT